MRITGKFSADKNFVTVYSNDTIYDLARNSREWSFVHVPGWAGNNTWIDIAAYRKYEAECTETGTFELNDNGPGWERIR